MKRKSLIFLLIMCALLSACGKSAPTAEEGLVSVESEAEKVEKTSFAEEKGFKFVELDSYMLPVTMYSTSHSEGIEFVTHPALLGTKIEATEVDEQGKVKYTITFTKKVITEALIPLDSSENYRWRISCGKSGIYDYYTGMEFISETDKEAVNDLRQKGEHNYSVSLEYNGKNVELQCAVEEKIAIERDVFVQGDKRVYSDEANVIQTISIIAPHDYDGLIIGFNPKYEKIIPENPLESEPESVEKIGYWGDEDEKVEDWEFVKVVDHVSKLKNPG